MDDDFTFGASVWGTTEKIDILAAPKPLLTPPLSAGAQQTFQNDAEFDDFDDFGTSQVAGHDGGGGDDFDDFGDFGDFGDVDTQPSGFAFEEPVAGPSTLRDWQPLSLDPTSSRADWEETVDDILAPIWDDEALALATSDEQMREVEGVSQILITAESRDLYNNLVQSTPPTKPPNWTRSRIRRQLLISLGIPVNLDEVLPQANVKPLPPLEITTRPMSAPPGPRNSAQASTSSLTTPANGSRAGTPQAQAQTSQFGPKPELDRAKMNTLLELEPDSLSLLPIPALERHLADLKTQIASTSSLLTYLLQVRESLQQDSETYNGLIAELVGEAQKIKTGKVRTAATTSRRGNGMV